MIRIILIIVVFSALGLLFGFGLFQACEALNPEVPEVPETTIEEPVEETTETLAPEETVPEPETTTLPDSGGIFPAF